MGIKHLNLTVTDVTAAREFLEKYFGLICSGTREMALQLCVIMMDLY